MRSAKLIKPGRIEIVDLPKPQPSAGQALVRVRAVGVCGTDIHIWKHGRGDVTLPLIPGQELAGVVEAVGHDVTNVAPGERVTLDPVISCGVCRVCRSGHHNVCPDVRCYGVQCDGGLCEYIAVDAQRLYRFPESLPFEHACLTEPFSIAVNIASRAAVLPYDRTVILGAGTIGLTALSVFASLGACAAVCDLSAKKRELAKALGAQYVFSSGEQLERELCGFWPEGADVVLDAVGIAPLLEQSLRLAAPAARVAVIGFDASAASVAPACITRRELTIVGSRMNNHRFPEVLRRFASGELDPSPFISAVYPLESAQEAFLSAANNPDNIKTVITV